MCVQKQNEHNFIVSIKTMILFSLMFMLVKHTPLITEMHTAPKQGWKIINIHIYNVFKASPL